MSRFRRAAAGPARHLCALALVVSLGPAAPATADQSATKTELRAAFLMNFAKFVEWPADALAADAALTFCIVGDPAVADALEGIVKGQTVAGRPLAVERRTLSQGFALCHVLFAPGLARARAVALAAALKGAAIFSIGDNEDFTRAGGVASLYVEGGQMRFAVNVQAAERARLQVSSRMLSLARIVKDGV